MPGGPVFDEPQSYIALAAVKFVGYTCSAYFSTLDLMKVMQILSCSEPRVLFLECCLEQP